MRVGIAGSMHHTEQFMLAKDALEKMGHETFVSRFAQMFIGKSDEEKERIKLECKYGHDAIRAFWDKMQGADALLVMNIERHGIPNYVGGNTLMEIGFAHVLGQRVFLLNPIPDIPYYKTEIVAVNPTIIHGDYSLVR